MSYFQKANNPRGSVTYATFVFREYLGGRERAYMVTDAVNELEVNYKERMKGVIDLARQALTHKNEDTQLSLMKQALELIEKL